jgi:F0F1-type ATP synthase assembly protein I
LSVPDPEEHSDQEKEEKNFAAGLAFAVMGTTAATCVAGGILLGLWFDGATGLSPLGILVGIVLGSVAAVVSVVQQIRRFL